MLLSNASILYQIDGISIEHGHQDAVESDDWIAPRHCLILHVSATVMFECFVNGNSYERRVVAGDVHIIPQGTSLPFRFRGPTELFLLKFDHTALLAIAPALVAVPDWQMAAHFCLRDPQISTLLRAVREAVRAGCSNGDPHIRNVGNTLLHYVATHYSTNANVRPAPVGGLPPKRLRSALEYIHSHLSSDPEELNLSRIAEAAGMKPQHFANLFRKSMETSPVAYAREQRIELAQRLLADTKKPIVEIAIETGFPNQSHFSDMFHKLVGTTPKRYRENCWQGSLGFMDEASGPDAVDFDVKTSRQPNREFLSSARPLPPQTGRRNQGRG